MSDTSYIDAVEARIEEYRVKYADVLHEFDEVANEPLKYDRLLEQYNSYGDSIGLLAISVLAAEPLLR